jgi:outer membrane autotransporter protein
MRWATSRRSRLSRSSRAEAPSRSPAARNALVTELGVNYAIGPSATIGIAYSGQYAGGSNENSGKASLTLRF